MRAILLALAMLLTGVSLSATAQPPPGGEPKITVTVFQLKKAKAIEVAATLETLLERRDFKPMVATNERRNFVLVNGDETTIKLARKIVTELERIAK